MGTRRPDAGAAPLPAPEVRAALLALNGPDVPYRVRAASPDEKADLVAECRVPRVGLTLTVRMRLIPGKREVRALEERWEKRTSGQTEAQYGRGHAPAVYRQWEMQRGPDGQEHRAEVFRFDTREMTDPLRDTVLGAGWVWRGVLRL
ncbi:hypothetical protein [Streptomyces achromogenes]|uniref:hypothetical protein n=1 Tax=Streptomyces achromogenes TaxID=67255 RepID=UPI001FD7659E|nr:hypothetical protein [Streptomyces achromogenes]